MCIERRVLEDTVGVHTPVVPLPSDDGWLLDLGLGGADTEALAALSLLHIVSYSVFARPGSMWELHFEGV